MIKKETINSLKKKIALGNTREVIETLLDLLQGHSEERTITLISAQYYQTKAVEISGTSDNSEVIMGYNQINNKLLTLFDDLEANGTITKEKPKEEIKQPLTEQPDIKVADIAQIFNLLSSSKFSKEAFIDFCRSTKGFLELGSKTNQKVSKKELIIALIIHADENELIAKLLEWAELNQPKEYKKYEPYYIQGITSVPPNERDVYNKFIKIKGFLPSQREPIIVISGRTGNGKSSTINAIVGEEVAEVGYDKVGQTKDFKHSWSYKDEKITIIDVPGLGQSETDDEEYIKIYKKWAGNADAFVVVINPPRPVEDGTIKTIDAFFEVGIQPQQIVFGLNWVTKLSYKDHNNKHKQVQIQGLLGPTDPQDIRAIEKLKIQFLKDLGKYFPTANFTIEQIVAYDAVTGWNVPRIFGAVVETLPIQAIGQAREQAKKATSALKKNLKTQEERDLLEKEDRDLAEKILNKGLELAGKVFKGVSSKLGNWFDKVVDKHQTNIKKVAETGVKFVKAFDKFLDFFIFGK